MREELIGRLNSVEISIDHPHYLVYRYYHADLFRVLKKYSHGHLIDIGCGNKPYEIIIKQQIEKYKGCDIVQSSDRRVDVICPANKIPLPSESFDTALSTQTIEHVEDPQGLINEAYRLLKPGGHFILSGPMYWPLHEEPYDFFRFTKYGFSSLLKNAGFAVEEESANGGKWALCGQALIQAAYPDIETPNSFKWRSLRLCFKLIGGIKGINRIFSKLDDENKDVSNTMNYVFVAKKM